MDATTHPSIQHIDQPIFIYYFIYNNHNTNKSNNTNNHGRKEVCKRSKGYLWQVTKVSNYFLPVASVSLWSLELFPLRFAKKVNNTPSTHTAFCVAATACVCVCGSFCLLFYPDGYIFKNQQGLQFSYYSTTFLCLWTRRRECMWNTQ